MKLKLKTLILITFASFLIFSCGNNNSSNPTALEIDTENLIGVWKYHYQPSSVADSLITILQPHLNGLDYKSEVYTFNVDGSISYQSNLFMNGTGTWNFDEHSQVVTCNLQYSLIPGQFTQEKIYWNVVDFAEDIISVKVNRNENNENISKLVSHFIKE